MEIRNRIFEAVRMISGDPSLSVGDATPLIGDGRVLDSMKLVELAIRLEDMAMELGFDFDWTSETALSKSKSMYRTAGTLAAEFLSQMDAAK